MRLEELLDLCPALTVVDSRSLDLFRSSPQAEVGSTGLSWAPAEGKADPSHSTQTWHFLGKGEQDKKNVPQISSTTKSGAAGMAAPPLQQGKGTGGWW